MQVYRVGECNNCGACCYFTFPNGRGVICPNYSTKSDLHCTIYDKRPQACRDFPANPESLQWVKKWCSIQFVDEQGKIVLPNPKFHGHALFKFQSESNKKTKKGK